MAKKRKSSTPKNSLTKKGSAKGSAKKLTSPKKHSKKDNKKINHPKQASKKKLKTTSIKSSPKKKTNDLKKAKSPKTNKPNKITSLAGKNSDPRKKDHAGKIAIPQREKPPKDRKEKPTASDGTTIIEGRQGTQNGNQSVSLTETAELNLKSTHPASFIAKQKIKLEELRDALLDQMADVAHDSLRATSENGGGAAFGQHMGDAGSEAYERDFALSLLSQEQDSLYEINEALRRIEMGTYGMCEKSGRQIPKERLEAIPWARYTVECQKNLEKSNIRRNRWESTPQFMDSLESEEETDEEDSEDESRVKNKE